MYLSVKMITFFPPIHTIPHIQHPSGSEAPKVSTRLKRCGTIMVKLIFNVPHVLIVRGKRSRIWSLPKGCINDNETEIECAKRETLEEAGVAVDITSSNIRIMINHNVYFVVNITNNPKLRIRDKGEIDKVSWMTINELRGLNCNKDLRSILQYPARKFAFHQHLVDVLKLSESVQPVDNTVEHVVENVVENVVDNVVQIVQTLPDQISFDRPPGL